MVRTKLVTLTLSPMCDQQREREVDWWEPVALLILVCVRKAAESHVAWKHVSLNVWWETESFSASLILFNFKDKHQITSLCKRTLSFFWPYGRHKMLLRNYCFFSILMLFSNTIYMKELTLYLFSQGVLMFLPIRLAQSKMIGIYKYTVTQVL